MKINDTKNLSMYGAELISKKIYPSNFEKDIAYEDYMLKPMITRRKFKLGLMELKILFKNTSEENIDIAVSNLSMQLAKCTICFAITEDKYETITYVCVLEKIEPTEEIFWDSLENKYAQENICTLNILWKCGNQITELMEKNYEYKTFDIMGNTETPCILEVTPSINLQSLVIKGVTEDPIIISNLTAGSKIIINGENGTILENGVNKFGWTNMWQFPSLTPGKRGISINTNTVEILLRYKPRFI